MSGFGWLAAGGLALTLAGAAMGQTTSTVSSPLVTAGNRSFQAGFATAPASDGQPSRNAVRLLYDHALSGRSQARVQLSLDDRQSDSLALSFLQLAWTQELTPEANKRWNSALRAEIRLAEGDRPEQAALNWFNQINLGDGWRIRANGQAMVQSGDRARNGVFVQTRFQAGRQAANGFFAGVDMLNNYGSSDGFGRFNEQGHSAGPLLGWRPNPNLRLNAGALIGLSEAAPDAEIRVWATWTLADDP